MRGDARHDDVVRGDVVREDTVRTELCVGNKRSVRALDASVPSEKRRKQTEDNDVHSGSHSVVRSGTRTISIVGGGEPPCADERRSRVMGTARELVLEPIPMSAFREHKPTRLDVTPVHTMPVHTTPVHTTPVHVTPMDAAHSRHVYDATYTQDVVQREHVARCRERMARAVSEMRSSFSVHAETVSRASAEFERTTERLMSEFTDAAHAMMLPLCPSFESSLSQMPPLQMQLPQMPVTHMPLTTHMSLAHSDMRRACDNFVRSIRANSTDLHTATRIHTSFSGHDDSGMWR